MSMFRLLVFLRLIELTDDLTGCGALAGVEQWHH